LNKLFRAETKIEDQEETEKKIEYRREDIRVNLIVEFDSTKVGSSVPRSFCIEKVENYHR